ncbi:MAG: choice-of-anchor J domain-containing protein [Ginsengibacter sp.]
MKKDLLLTFLFIVFSFSLVAQQPLSAINPKNTIRCATQISIEQTIRKNPEIVEVWRKEGERQYSSYLQRQALKRGPLSIEETEIIIPIVFHLVDDSTQLSGITDRDIYEQVELLNKAFSGRKAERYDKVIPKEIYNRLGRIPIKFVLARRTPTGTLTSGIERRVNKTPDRIKIKSTNTGGLDAWDTEKYLNVWAGGFSGDDNGLLGIATPPFYTSEGPQGVVMALNALPYTSNTKRSYYPAYSEGGTLIHEIGHYFYLWHTFGDSFECNNNDFRIQQGWPLPIGAGPEGDDTPEEKADEEGNAHFGNPSQNYSDGCASTTFGMMYGSFMNYFDDRALFMFSNGMNKRVIGCIDSYRPGLKTSNGATPPMAVTDAYLVTTSPRGTPERRAYIANNTPLEVLVRNNGTIGLNRVTDNVKLNSEATVAYTFNLNLAPGSDTTLAAGILTCPNGTHTLTVSTSNPNNGADAFTNNDTLQSFIYISNTQINAPFTEEFSSGTFPPAGWRVWNPNDNATWERNEVSGFTGSGSATVQNYSYSGGGQLDDLITPIINTGVADSSLLNFKVAYKVYNDKDVSMWDGLEVYVSNDGGKYYDLAYKKS